MDNMQVHMGTDVYDLVIGANFVSSLTPIEERFCIGQCMLTFMIQLYVIYAFVSSSLDFDAFQPFLMKHMVLRFLLCFLYSHMNQKEMRGVVNLMTFLDQ